jgi:hypothetical protein
VAAAAARDPVLITADAQHPELFVERNDRRTLPHGWF